MSIWKILENAGSGQMSQILPHRNNKKTYLRKSRYRELWQLRKRSFIIPPKHASNHLFTILR